MGARTPFAVVVASLALHASGGCLHTPAPSLSFPAPASEIDAAWCEMAAEPVGLDRPLVVIDGWLPLGSDMLARELIELTGAEESEVVQCRYFPPSSVESRAAAAIGIVERAWPCDDPEWTTEVDVVGFSAGGVVARAAALPDREGVPRKRLRIHALYTIATPHRGTVGLAHLLPLDSTARAVRGGSETQAYLDAALPDAGYEMVCYTQLGDEIVGARNAAPPGKEPIWTEARFPYGHSAVCGNKRILADIARRLRGEAPLAGEPSAPPRD